MGGKPKLRMALFAGTLALLVLLGSALTGLATSLPAPTLDQPGQNVELGPGWLCVRAPTTITRGNTEAIEANIELTDSPSGDSEGRVCEPLAIYEVMGVGIAGIQLDNFEIDPPDIRVRDRLDPDTVNNFTWIISAVGEDSSRHNLIVYAYIDDPDRSTGFRSIARIPVRITIEAAPKTLSESILEFLDSAKEILVVLGGLITAGIAFRGQVRKLLVRNPDAEQ